MTHKRILIRNEFVRLIEAGSISLGGNVFGGRYYTIDELSLPACVVNIDGEVSQIGTTMINPRSLERQLVIRLDLYTKGNFDHSEFLAEISSEIEKAMTADTTLKGLALDLFLSSYQEVLNGEQNNMATMDKVGFAQLTYDVRYDTPENNPEG